MGLCFVMASTVMYAGGMNIPTHVRDAFHKDYPDASAVHWKYTNGKWDASFHKMDGNMTVWACYDLKGKHIDSRMPVAQSAIPVKLQRKLDSQYPGQYNHHLTKVEIPNKRDLYQVKVKEEGSYRTKYFDRRGHERDYASR